MALVAVPVSLTNPLAYSYKPETYSYSGAYPLPRYPPRLTREPRQGLRARQRGIGNITSPQLWSLTDHSEGIRRCQLATICTVNHWKFKQFQEIICNSARTQA